MKFNMLFICVFIFCISCIQLEKEQITLMIDFSESKIQDSRFAFDSVSFLYNDSINIYYYLSYRSFNQVLNATNDKVYEVINTYDEISDELIKQDTLLYFSLKDTAYTYLNENKRILTILDYRYASCKFYFKESENSWRMTIKQSLVDSTYKEIYFYDKNFRVNKFINTWQDNLCVYK